MSAAAPDMQAAPEGAAVETVDITYGDRWAWIKGVMSQPSDALSDATKNVLFWIFEQMDKKTSITVRKYATLATYANKKESGVRGCISKAVKAGWLKSEGKGGIIYDEAGKASGIANRFSMSVPATAIARMNDTCDETATYLLWNGDLPAMKLEDTCYGHSDNTPYSSPSLSPRISPSHAADEARQDSLDREKESSSTSSLNHEMAMELHSDRSSTSPTDNARTCVLPVATIEMRSAWGDRWPSDEAMAIKSATIGHALANVAEQCWFAMGYNLTDSRARKDETGQPPYDFIRDRLRPEWVDEIARQMVAGGLKVDTLANLMAYLGFEPKQVGEVSERDEQVG
ncbi:hypothetical protein [Mesorhizobium sp.]|uniref:hypothetical protein n=1 Tax=Mesorhizobium sp. TaxID=1871066 RepID=UPI000FE9E671|nr:hypothetical protein [Mesorhizobium sp.]RWP80469.1 MAG: hypothetical protein EOR10_08475 [Mesorhizobium sp.]